jgi:ribose/xylose/arabinose/galactoside ABC-type transport system permease subunit
VYAHTILRIIRNTHRHPANKALHFIGAPFYLAGLVGMLGHFAGMQQQYTTTTIDTVAGAAMWLAAIAMFVLGHKIEGNIGSMTPVLLFRLLSRKVARYPIAQRVHPLWA